ncbi:MAG TPA: DNA gyrase subunit A [Anaerolineae bacterium]|nr:DNA gyrase subunit A [Anaerolineae bacterium]
MAARSKAKSKALDTSTHFGNVRQIDIDTEMQQAYLDYAMSVIVARALPDVRDGLKPVHRRILYAMHDMGLQPNTAYKKSARIVGEVLGKYHPHGDAAVYDAMSRMAQDFSLRYLLVDGQGNFGSVDGDAPAAMRYTEARLASMAAQLLLDIEKNTVEFGANFDGSLKEPLVLPSAIPNLLLSGASGIAVGMATNIPPHNLSEVCDALVYLIGRWDKIDRVTVDELMMRIKGPDFPTGGIVFRYNESVEGGDAIRAAYATGRGRLTIQAKAFIEEAERGKSRIIVTELPYQVNKSSLIERIADLVRDGKLEGITDLRDESDQSGMRIIIELSRTVEDPRKMLALLYKYTPMQSTFGIINLALVEGEPRLLPLKRMLQLFVEHRQVIIRRRSEFDLTRAKERAHILEGLLKALANLDAVIRLIRSSADADAAKLGLMKRFKLSDVQATAILDMPLRRLARLEREKLDAEYKEKKALIKHLEDLLKDPKKILGVIKNETLVLKEKFGDARRTQIVEKKGKEAEVVTSHDLVTSESAWISIYQDGSVFRMPIGPAILEGKAPAAFVHADSRDTIIVVTERGQAGAIAAHQISSQGMPVAEVFGVPSDQRVVAVFALPKEVPDLPGFLFMTTRQGVVKRVTLIDLAQAFGSFNVMNVADDDAIVAARVTPGEAEMILVTANGQSIRFSEEDVRAMGFNAGGVAGVKLADKDQVIGADVAQARSDLLLLTQNGSGKRSALANFPKQGRAGQGVVAIKLATGDQVAGVAVVQAADQVVIVTSRGKAKLFRARSAKNAARAAAGSSAYHLTKTEKIVAVIKPAERVVGLVVQEETKPQEKPATTKERKPAAKPKAVKRSPITAKRKSK